VNRTYRLFLALCVFAPPALQGAARPEPVARIAPTICDGTSALTLIGIDTTNGRMLFSVPPLQAKDRPWVIELDAEVTAARAYPDPPKGLFSG
jgi:hypothetical protein